MVALLFEGLSYIADTFILPTLFHLLFSICKFQVFFLLHFFQFDSVVISAASEKEKQLNLLNNIFKKAPKIDVNKVSFD